MFGHIDEATTKRLQRIDNALQDDEIESKIKECQRENGQAMKSTTRNLRKKFSDEQVTRVLRRLSTRRYRGNKYQQKGINQITQLFEKLTKTNDRMTTQSSFEL